MFETIMRDYLLVDNNDFLSNPTVAVKTLYYFGRWLYANKFTNQSLKYNFWWFEDKWLLYVFYSFLTKDYSRQKKEL